LVYTQKNIYPDFVWILVNICPDFVFDFYGICPDFVQNKEKNSIFAAIKFNLKSQCSKGK
jgi:hypothetical protein